MNNYDIYIYFIFIFKILFFITALYHIYLKYNGEINSEVDKNVLYWKNRLDFIFKILIAILLIYLFNPYKKNIVIEGETKILLFLFGIIFIFSADFTTFIHNSKWYVYVKTLFP